MLRVLLLIAAFLPWVFSGLKGASLELPFQFPTDPDRWREEDFEKRFKGSYGINAYLEPELDVDNFNVYDGVLAFLDNKEGAITFIKNSMATLNEQGIEVSGSLNFLLGNFYYEAGQHDLAVEQYIEAVHKHPSFLRAYENLGYSFMQSDDNEKALPVLLKALELGSNDSQIHGLIGFLYLDKKLYLSALTAFESAMLFNPRNNTWRHGIFQCLVNLGRNEDALGVAEEILLFDPDNHGSWQNVTSLLLRLGREDEAISHLEVFHKLGGGSYLTRRLLGNLYYNRKMFEASVSEFQLLIDLATEGSELEDLLEVCEGLLYFEYVEEAQQLLTGMKKKAGELGSQLDPAGMEFIQAIIYFENGLWVQARSALEKVLETNPAQARAILYLGHTCVQIGEVDQAGIYFEMAQMYEETRYDAFYAQAQILLGFDQTGEALEKLRQAYSIRPSDELSRVISSLEETGRLIP